MASAGAQRCDCVPLQSCVRGSSRPMGARVLTLAPMQHSSLQNLQHCRLSVMIMSIMLQSELADQALHAWHLRRQVSSHVGQLTALQTLRMLGSPALLPALDPLQLPVEVAQLASSLRRLSFCSKAVPLELTALQSLSRLSICGLLWSHDVGTQASASAAKTTFGRAWDC